MKKEDLGVSAGPSKSAEMSNLLKSFGIRHESVFISEGKYCDSYFVRLSSGEKYSKISSIMPEIGMFFKSESLPIGKADMPNGTFNISLQKSKIVSPDMLSMIASLKNFGGLIKIALGVSDYGQEVFFDLNDVPNLLVGGTTGSGKSVVMHNMILSCLMSRSVDVILVDPKRVEFSIYEDWAKIIKDTSEFKLFLADLEAEMNKRYEILERFKTKNISEFNSKYKSIRMRPIAVFVDEWADIFMSDNKINFDLCRIAQKSRASGISFVLATQRPSVDVISGLLKSNFPGRIALKVASSHDSRTILDCSGAESLEEKGVGYFISGCGKKIKFKTGYIENIREIIKCNRFLR